MTEARPEILLKTDKKTIVLEIETESKFVARAMGWDETGHIIGRKYRDQPRRRPVANR
jgi:hypothetical protein